MRLKTPDMKKLKRLQSEGKIQIGLPGGQGDMDWNTYISVSVDPNNPASKNRTYLALDLTVDECTVVDSPYTIHKEVYEKFKDVFEEIV